ncbi:MAG: rhodanese-like domain-containing protein [Treponemataceae bacterium]
MLSIFSGFSQAKKEPSFNTISINETKALIQAGNFILIDVRTPEEFNEGYLKNAINLNLYTTTQKITEDTVPNKDTTILVYCRSGKRSKEFSQMLNSWGYKNIHNIGGYQDLVKNKILVD